MTVAGVPEAGKAEAATNKALDALDRYNPQLNAVAARFDAAAVADAGHRDLLATKGTNL